MPAKNINVAELKDLMAKNEVCLIDVREVAEHSVASIPGSVLIPLSEFSSNKIPQFGDKKLVIHCRSGKRSLTACEKFLEENPNAEVYNLEGGIIAWDLMGGEVKKSDVFF
jgi:rhodanese-related sulfurtransferase